MGVALLGRRLFVIDSNGSADGAVIELGRAGQRLVAAVHNPEGVIAVGGRLLVADDRPEHARILSLEPDSGALTTIAEHHGLADPEGLSWGQDPGVAMARPAPPSTVPPALKWPAHCGPLR
jgi:hypothetical protein